MAQVPVCAQKALAGAWVRVAEPFSAAKRSHRSALPAALARRGAAAAFRSALGCLAVSLLAALRLFPLRRLLLLLEALTALSALQVGVPCDC